VDGRYERLGDAQGRFRDKYRRYIAQAPEDADLKRKARTAVTAKMVRVIYAVIKDDQPYRALLSTVYPADRSLSVEPSRPSGPRG
jgi:hypothetical protein